MIVKICGMREPNNIAQVENLTINWMGFIFVPQSPRYVAETPIYLPTQCKRVGVFVDPNPQTCYTKAIEYKLDFIQLHGSESPQFCDNMRRSLHDQLPHLQIIKAFRIQEPADFDKLKPYTSVVDYFLFDTPCAQYGGSGESFDWNILTHYQDETPFLLSGGIGLHNVQELRQFTHPRLVGIDLNSRFETAPAQKDVTAIANFLTQLSSNHHE